MIFQGAGNGDDFKKVIDELEIRSLIKFIKPVPFLSALNNMMNADALLLIQDKRFNKQIPGKIYEYLRTNKPLLVKADTMGETYKLASQFQNVQVGNNTEELTTSLLTLLNKDQVITQRNLVSYNREGKAQALQHILLEQVNLSAVLNNNQ